MDARADLYLFWRQEESYGRWLHKEQPANTLIGFSGCQGWSGSFLCEYVCDFAGFITQRLIGNVIFPQNLIRLDGTKLYPMVIQECVGVIARLALIFT